MVFSQNLSYTGSFNPFDLIQKAGKKSRKSRKLRKGKKSRKTKRRR
jgi:hypothetical protein